MPSYFLKPWESFDSNYNIVVNPVAYALATGKGRTSNGYNAANVPIPHAGGGISDRSNTSQIPYTGSPVVDAAGNLKEGYGQGIGTFNLPMVPKTPASQASQFQVKGVSLYSGKTYIKEPKRTEVPYSGQNPYNDTGNYGVISGQGTTQERPTYQATTPIGVSPSGFNSNGIRVSGVGGALPTEAYNILASASQTASQDSSNPAQYGQSEFFQPPIVNPDYNSQIYEELQAYYGVTEPCIDAPTFPLNTINPPPGFEVVVAGGQEVAIRPTQDLRNQWADLDSLFSADYNFLGNDTWLQGDYSVHPKVAIDKTKAEFSSAELITNVNILSRNFQYSVMRGKWLPSTNFNAPELI
jgi:hypothetical protein